MGKPLRGRPSFRDTQISHAASERYYALSMSPDDPRQAAAQARVAKLQAAIPPKRDRIKRPVDGKPVYPLEKEIQKDILAAIEVRRDVVFVGRFNRGKAVSTDAYGKTRYTAFNSVFGFPDIHGLLVGGQAFYIEVKRPHPNYEKPSDDQQKFLDAARDGGAIAGVAVSVAEALALLP